MERSAVSQTPVEAVRMILLTDNMVITQDTTLTPRIYCIPSGIRIEGRDITLDGNGSTLVGEKCNGRGLYISNSHHITIKNLTIQSYRWGIYTENTDELTISNCNIHSTDEISANTIFLDIWIPVERVYGGGILLHKVKDGRILDNDLSHQMNGVLTYQCDQLLVKHNLANYCSGWGFHLNHTTNSLFEDNSADYCCRYEPRGLRRGHMGADSAGFLIINRSSSNKFLRNYARLGGDDFFLAGMNPDYELVSCDDNLFEENDASYSPNNAFEATFSRGNIFRSNYANHSNYGFWLGFSRDGTIEDNQLIGNRQAGIAVENGIDFRVNNNVFSDNQHGILLWSKRLPKIEASLPDNLTSRNWNIQNNAFKNNFKAIRIAANQDHGIRPLPDHGEFGFPSPKPKNHVIRRNLFIGNVYVIDQFDTMHTAIDMNDLKDNVYG